MKSFPEESAELASPETFDPAAFQSSAEVPQDLCNFILALALIYNDCKDIIYARLLLGESRPPQPPRKNRLWGAWMGVDFHIFRAIVGVMHELFNLVRDNETVISHPFMRSVVQQLPRLAREGWDAVTAVALGATPADPLGKRLLLLRNKVASHYDPTAIVAGYRHHFLSADRQDDRAFISRGSSMKTTRFYFADAAATGYLRSIVGKDESQELLMMNVAELLSPVNHALMGIVETFVQRRGYAYRAVTETV